MAADRTPDFFDPADLDLDLEDLITRYGRAFQGTIKGYHPARGVGSVETSAGVVHPFSLNTATIGGAARHPRQLRNGMRVTFDLARVDGGHQVVKIWVGPLPDPIKALAPDPEEVE